MPITKIPGKKKDGLQAYRVRVNYTSPDGEHKRVERISYGLAEAKEMERQLKADIDNPRPEPEFHSPTVEDLVAEYTAYQSGEIRKTTLDKSSSILRLHVLPLFSEMPLDQLSVKDISKWKTHMNTLGLSVTTKNKAYSVFRAIMNYAKKMKYISENPVTELGPFRDPNFGVRGTPLRFYTTDQWKLYASTMRSSATSFITQGVFVFFCIAYYTGMRKGEINALKWSDISGNVINVTRSISQKVKGVAVTETAPKNRTSFRSIQIPVPLKSVLDEHLNRQMMHPDWTEDYRVCGGPKPISDSYLDNMNRQTAKAAKLPHIRVHDFRHSHASLLINEGINIQEIARRLGHSDVKMTWNTYGHLYPQETERALSVLNRVLLHETKTDPE